MEKNILARNNVKLLGQGVQPILFAHGFGCDQNMWRFVAPFFARDYRLVLFDYVGSGHSDLGAYNPERYGNLNGYAQDVLDICEALDLRDVILVGHSVSAMIALLAAIKQPERFHRLVFVCPSPRYVNDAPDYVGGFERGDLEELLALMDRNDMGWASFLAPRVMRNPQQPALTEELIESFCSTAPVMARRFAEVTFFSDNRGDLSKLTVPSLILQCAEDLLAPVQVGEYVHRHVPQSTLRILQTQGHCPHMSEPEVTSRFIQNYLRPP